MEGLSWQVSYADGSFATGNVYSDSVQIGDLVISGQAIQVAQNVSESILEDVAIDGILGLAFSKINTSRSCTSPQTTKSI